MKLDIKFDVDFEVQRVSNTLNKIDWFKTHGYIVKLPKKINNDSTKNNIEIEVTREFDNQKYLVVANEILTDFKKIEEELSQKIEEVFKENTHKKISLYLTSYGTGGSYHPPSTIVFNIHNLNVLKTIVHEIIHLFVEPYIKKYNVRQWEKERIVDSILNSEEFGFLEYNHWQGNYHGAEKYIDSLFKDSFFEDIDQFFSKIQKVR